MHEAIIEKGDLVKVLYKETDRAGEVVDCAFCVGHVTQVTRNFNEKYPYTVLFKYTPIGGIEKKLESLFEESEVTLMCKKANFSVDDYDLQVGPLYNSEGFTY